MFEWLLLRAMVLKEVRSLVRERSQMTGLLIGVAMPIIAIGAMVYQGTHSSRGRSGHRPPSSIVTVAPGSAGDLTRLTGLPAKVLPWAAIAMPAFLGFFFSMSYLLSAVLASFVGEKEAKTLEILLASPLSDRKLFFAKCISVLLPSVGIGYLFMVSAALLAIAFVPVEIVRLPVSLLACALILSLPVMMLPQIWLVGLGAAVSARAETMKGAGQVLGAFFMLPFFGCIYGVPLLLQHNPSLRQAAINFGQSWLTLPFAAQYGMVLFLLSIPAFLCMGLGRAFFRRDRMLT